MKEFYLKLIEAVTGESAIDMFTEKSLPAMQQVDMYRGQYLYEADYEQLRLPALLVEYNINHQSNVATINLHCVWEQTQETDNISVGKEEALRYFDWLDSVYELTQGLESKNTGKLTLTTEGTQQDDTPTHVHLFTFECSYMGRVQASADKYNYAEGEEVQATGNIQAHAEQPKYDFS